MAIGSVFGGRQQCFRIEGAKSSTSHKCAISDVAKDWSIDAPIGRVECNFWLADFAPAPPGRVPREGIEN
jgi:hypothetical protein